MAGTAQLDVPHVAAAEVRIRRAGLDPVGAEVPRERGDERHVVLHRRRAAREDRLAGRPGRERRSGDEVPEPVVHLREVRLVGGPDHEPADGAVGDDVRRGAALDDDPVHARVRAQLLAPEPDRLEEEQERVERVPAHPRVGGGMRRPPGEHDVDVLAREQADLHVVLVARVIEERGVEAVEQPVVEHELLARPSLLRRGAEEHDLAGQLVAHGRERDRRPDPGGRHRVVPAPVAEARERVVLREDADARAIAAATAAERRAHGGGEPPGGPLDGVPMRGDHLRDALRRPVLLERGLGVRVDAVGEVEDLVPVRLHCGGDPRLRVGEGLGGDGRERQRHA